jgi:hypothetical protein
MNDDRQLKIHFNNGDKLIVTFPPKLKGSTAAVMEAMKKVMETDKLVIEAEGKLVIIPWSSMKQLELTPTPAALPFGAIQGARISQEATA